MKFTFGFYNCYWLFITNAKELEFALENLHMTSHNLERYIEILQKGDTIFLNENGGYHSGDPMEKTEQIVKDSPRYPSKQDRIDVMQAELVVSIHEMQDAAGIPRTENMTF